MGAAEDIIIDGAPVGEVGERCCALMTVGDAGFVDNVNGRAVRFAAKPR